MCEGFYSYFILKPGIGIDLSLCHELQDLYIVPTTDFSKNAQRGLELLEFMLASWNTQQPSPTLTIGAYYQSCNFTRHEFANVLHTLSAVAERWLKSTQVADDSSRDEGRVQYWVDIVIYDLESHREWWWDRVADSFPTWVRLGRLEMDYYTRE